MALNPVLRASNINFGFQFTKILNAIRIDIYSEERIALLGPSGSGKSTLLKIMAGLIKPDSGSLFFHDTDMHNSSLRIRDLARRKMGLLFQKNALFDSHTSIENITFSLKESGVELDDARALQIAIHNLDAVGLSHAHHLFPDEMSGGMQKRLGIARAQSLMPDLLLYDDPTAGLDPITSRHIIDLILKLQAERRSTILVVTNEILRAFQLANRVLFLCQGQLLDLGSPEQARRSTDPRVQQFLRADSHGPLKGIV